MELTKAQIRKRTKEYDIWLTAVRTAMLPAAVTESRTRFVVAVLLTGDRQQIRDVDIELLEDDGATYTMKASKVHVSPADNVWLPPNYDIEQAFLRMNGGTQLYGTVSGNSLQSTVIYWDDEI